LHFSRSRACSVSLVLRGHVPLTFGTLGHYGKGFSRTNLYQFKQLYEMFPEIVQTASGQFASLLTWSHYAPMLRVFDKDARDWYANEAASQNWSVQTLARNIDTQYYYRLLMS